MESQIRALTKRIPFRAPATLMNVALAAVGRLHGTPTWRVSEGPQGYPAMELNIASAFQRRMFYFPLAYWNRLMGLPFGRFLAQVIKPGSVFLDIGANIGFYSLYAASRVGSTGAVYAFEPDPMTFESLTRSARCNGFGWLRSLNLALSDRQGELPFFTVSDGSAHSLVPEIPKRAGRYSGKVNVRVTTLDELMKNGELSLQRVDLIKLDVEGEEARTVAGMVQTLEQVGWPLVWAEVRGPRGSTRAPNTFIGVQDQLAKLGYAAHRWQSGVLRELVPGSVRGREDILFKRSGAEGLLTPGE